MTPRRIPRQIGRILAVAALCLVAHPALATREYILPTLFNVDGVAANDVLNVRARPDASSPIIGTLAPDAQDIEVVEEDETARWGRINLREDSGWVSMRYLAYQVGVWEEGRIPPNMMCLGTEPFWSLRHDNGQMTLSKPDQEDQTYAVDAVAPSPIFRDPRRVILTSDGETRLTAFIVPRVCSDGMSDRTYGLEATIVHEEETPELLLGCCTIQPAH